MSNLKNLVVEKSTVTKNLNYCNKLVCKTINTQATAFGTAQSEQTETYYLFTTQANQVGAQGSLDIALFDLVEKPFNMPNEDGTVTNINLKYLYPKRV